MRKILLVYKKEIICVYGEKGAMRYVNNSFQPKIRVIFSIPPRTVILQSEIITLEYWNQKATARTLVGLRYRKQEIKIQWNCQIPNAQADCSSRRYISAPQCKCSATKLRLFWDTRCAYHWEPKQIHFESWCGTRLLEMAEHSLL